MLFMVISSFILGQVERQLPRQLRRTLRVSENDQEGEGEAHKVLRRPLRRSGVVSPEHAVCKSLVRWCLLSQKHIWCRSWLLSLLSLRLQGASSPSMDPQLTFPPVSALGEGRQPPSAFRAHGSRRRAWTTGSKHWLPSLPPN